MKQLFYTTFIFIILTNTVNAQSTAKLNCISSKCHATFGKAKFVHGPVADVDCSPCHKLLPKENHKFEKIMNAGQLCGECHESMDGTKAVVHVPVKDGDCTACHDPHQSSSKAQIKKRTISEICFTCHDEGVIKKKYTHGPAADGDCMTCHTPHASAEPKLLAETGNELCFQCHSDLKEGSTSAKHMHKPVSEGCTKCHNPHSHDSPYMMSNTVPNMCFTCHPSIKDHLAKSSVKHKAVGMERLCMNCHVPHESKFVKLLKNEPMEQCLSCHDRTITTENSGILMNMKEWLKNNKNWHGPVQDKDCESCHDPHGGAYFRLLKQFYPKEFYISFSKEQYELCLSCHEPTLIEVPNTNTMTDFRDGDLNLHFVHVNKKVKGRTCRACHETHASQNPKHIRETVPFGKWALHIGFEKTSDGGKCSPGCHSPKSYNQTAKTYLKK